MRKNSFKTKARELALQEKEFFLNIFKISAAILSLNLFGSTAFAAFGIEELHSATKIATAQFAESKPEHLEHFSGYKSWKSNEDAKVKIYVSHDGMNIDFSYLCHKHDDAIECHEQ